MLPYTARNKDTLLLLGSRLRHDGVENEAEMCRDESRFLRLAQRKLMTDRRIDHPHELPISERQQAPVWIE